MLICLVGGIFMGIMMRPYIDQKIKKYVNEK